VKIEGTLYSIPSTRRKKERFTLQFFSSSQAEPSGFGEGEIFLGRRA
jgi:hypothetical protein